MPTALVLSIGKPGKHSILWCRLWLTSIDRNLSPLCL